MPNENIRGQGDLVLAPSQFAYVLDRTKGHVNVYVGPSKTSLSDTDSLVKWSDGSKMPQHLGMSEAVQGYPDAPEDAYIILTNPAKDGQTEHPKEGQTSSLVALDFGRKVNIPGPASFALWPQQTAQVLKGHALKTNEYLVVKVYNEAAAKTNWTKGVVKTKPHADATTPPVAGGADDPVMLKGMTDEQKAAMSATRDKVNAIMDGQLTAADLFMGQRIIIKGTEVSFYIPPTGVEVVPDNNGNYVRDAVSLEQLEYCVMLDEDGAKRFIRGPAVVFPEPTETFHVDSEGKVKHRAKELNVNSGVYVKVISSYEENGKEYKIGDELFITGKDQAIYYPRPEHAIIKYGEQSWHYAIAVPAGEGRYVLDNLTGNVSLVKGPTMLLPDPRTKVIVRRILDPRVVELMYPGNSLAVKINQDLYASSTAFKGYATPEGVSGHSGVSGFSGLSGSGKEEFHRKTSYTPPRSITLENKYDGAVTVGVWPGYAVLVTSKTGKRYVVSGPKTFLLEFDESLQPLEFSTGTPKTSDSLFRTVYLRALNNRVSDRMTVVTADNVEVEVGLSYRVNFTGESEKWFDVENYIQLLCDHGRSLLRKSAKKIGIEEFSQNAIDIIRDTILGKCETEGKPRPGRTFAENGMHVYDVEILDTKINNVEISGMLLAAQHKAVKNTLAIGSLEQDLILEKKTQAVTREKINETSDTKLSALVAERKYFEQETEFAAVKAARDASVSAAKTAAELAMQEVLKSLTAAEIDRASTKTKAELASNQARHDQDLKQKSETEAHRLANREKESQIAIAWEAAQAEALKTKLEGFSEPLVTALTAFGDKDLAVKVATAMGPLAILKDSSVADSFVQMAKGTNLENIFNSVLERLKK